MHRSCNAEAASIGRHRLADGTARRRSGTQNQITLCASVSPLRFSVAQLLKLVCIVPLALFSILLLILQTYHPYGVYKLFINRSSLIDIQYSVFSISLRLLENAPLLQRRSG